MNVLQHFLSRMSRLRLKLVSQIAGEDWMDRRLHNLQRLSKNLETFVWSNQTFTSKLAQQGNILLKGRDAKSSRYGKYICTISLELVLFFWDMLARTSSIITSVISTSRISTRAIITTHPPVLSSPVGSAPVLSSPVQSTSAWCY